MIGGIWLARAAVRIDHFVKCQRRRSPYFCPFEYNGCRNARSVHSRARRIFDLRRSAN
ncbi:hypothetical protein SAMCFNEI73_Ch2741 [Sinorhizobium americanum]|uniref:Uncharacterized protein n=1 Tax=Sinorhizobium americanum TaxID=194963 RepID=A0A1L3LPP6_9HYPH|nr:hypothetical protein SAMCCGM7_Ch2618 [Sinorhizobium americanum CCGM7]APG92016.1 hypothetical protein SAMCFNEI73_Ch2741 [Sinorhizobium americanum]